MWILKVFALFMVGFGSPRLVSEGRAPAATSSATNRAFGGFIMMTNRARQILSRTGKDSWERVSISTNSSLSMGFSDYSRTANAARNGGEYIILFSTKNLAANGTRGFHLASVAGCAGQRRAVALSSTCPETTHRESIEKPSALWKSLR